MKHWNIIYWLWLSFLLCTVTGSYSKNLSVPSPQISDAINETYRPWFSKLTHDLSDDPGFGVMIKSLNNDLLECETALCYVSITRNKKLQYLTVVPKELHSSPTLKKVVKDCKYLRNAPPELLAPNCIMIKFCKEHGSIVVSSQLFNRTIQPPIR